MKKHIWIAISWVFTIISIICLYYEIRICYSGFLFPFRMAFQDIRMLMGTMLSSTVAILIAFSLKQIQRRDRDINDFIIVFNIALVISSVLVLVFE